ncbi:MAG: YhdP family protein [Endozoicomonas sp. (ex Botrylloides leachii)]|nr:YhdP family protein [Endozoicomonas sp. (ex Botrylloides leachii)]
MNQALLRLYNWSWRLLIASLLIVLVVIMGARIIVTCLPFFQTSLISYLDKQLGVSLKVGSLSTNWHGGMPILTVKELDLQSFNTESSDLTIDQLDLELNLPESLLHRTPVFTYLKVRGVYLKLKEDQTGEWTLANLAIQNSSQNNLIQSRLFNWLHYQRHLDITALSLEAMRNNGRNANLQMPYFSFKNQSNEKRVDARVELGSGSIGLSGHGFAEKGWNGKLFFNHIDFGQACLLYAQCHNRVTKAIVGGDLSWFYEKGQWQVAGNLEIPTLDYTSTSGKKHTASGNTSLFSEGIRGAHWSLWLNNTALKLDEHILSSGNWYMASKLSPEYSVTIANKQIQLAPLKKILLQSGLLPSLPAKLLTTLNPSGTINDFALKLYPFRKPFDIDLSAKLDRVAIAAWHDAPSASNVSGVLRMSLLKGYFDLNAHQFSFGLLNLFPKTWHYDTAKTRLYWAVADKTYTLKSDLIKLKGKEGQLTGQLALDIPLNAKPSTMALTVGLKEGKLQGAKQYIPTKLPALSSGLANWLGFSLQRGVIHQGGFVYNGVIEKTNTPEDANWGLYFDMSDALFHYHKDWPAITALNGKVFVNNNRVEVQGKKMQMLGANLTNIIATVPLKGDTIVSVKGRALFKKNSFHKLLTETPINDLLAGAAKTWQLKGDLASQVELTIPVAHPENTKVEVKGKVKNYTFALPEYKVSVDHINGDINFSTVAGLTSKKLRGILWHQPVDASISSVVADNRLKMTKVHWNSKINIKSIHDLLAINSLNLLKGETRYSGVLAIDQQHNKTTVDINSDLQGVAVDLPEPFYKKADAKQSLFIKYIAQAGDNGLNLTLKDLMKAEVHLNVDNTVQGAAIVLGQNVQIGTPLPSIQPKIIRVQGALTDLDITPWYNRFKEQASNNRGHAFFDWLRLDNISIGQLQYENHSLHHVHIGLKPHEQSLQLTLKSDAVSGSLWVPENVSEPYQLVINRLLLPEKQDDKHNSAQQNDLTVSPLSIPEADVSIEKLVIGKKTINQLSFKVRKVANGIKVEPLQATVSSMAFKGHGEWLQRNGRQYTWVSGELDGRKIEQLQKDFGFSPFIQAKESTIKGRLNWEGSPFGVNFFNVLGTVDLHIRDGRLKKLEGGTDALKLFGLLNTESLRRRLKLDFSDLFASGISFDKLDGALHFNKGMITFNNPIVITGPSSDFKLNGVINGNEGLMDMSVVVTLPFSSNLPIFSVLLGAAPQVTGIIFLADQLLGSKVDQLASIRYQIKGPLDNPKVSLDKLFSNKTKKTNKK